MDLAPLRNAQGASSNTYLSLALVDFQLHCAQGLVEAMLELVELAPLRNTQVASKKP